MHATTQLTHSPGPWHKRGTAILKSPRCIIAEVFRDVGYRTAIANSDLIAAAPELLDALEEAREVLALPSAWPKNELILQKINAALAKAKGTPSEGYAIITSGPMPIARGIQYYHPGQVIAPKDARRAKATRSEWGVAWSLYHVTQNRHFDRPLECVEQVEDFRPDPKRFIVYRDVRCSNSRVLVKDIFRPRFQPL
jgi:hypothetical protein